MLAQEEIAFSEAEIAEKNFEWLRTAQLYREISDSKGSTRTGHFRFMIIERIIRCFTRASRQSEDSQQFKERARSAIETCNSAVTLNPEVRGLDFYFRSRSLLLETWIADDADSRLSILKKAVLAADEAFDSLDKSRNLDRYLLNFSAHLLNCYEELWIAERDREKLDQIISRSLSVGTRAIDVLSAATDLERDDLFSLARIYGMTAWFCGLAVLFYESLEKREELLRLREEYWKKFDSITEKLDDLITTTESLFYRQEDIDPRIMRERAVQNLPKVMVTRDNLLIGGLLSQIPHAMVPSTSWENATNVNQMKEQIEGISKDALTRFGRTKPFGIFWDCFEYAYEIPNHWYLDYSGSPAALSPEDKRLEVIEKSLDALQTAYRQLNKYCHRAAIHLANDAANANLAKAQLFSNPDRKRELLIEALEYSKKAIHLEACVEPHRDSDHSAILAVYSDIQSDLALLEQNRERRIALVKGAIESYTRALHLRDLAHGPIRDPNADLFDLIWNFVEGLQHMWKELYELTGDKNALIKRLEFLEEERSILEKINLPSYLAGIQWKIGYTRVMLGNHVMASKFYTSASESFAQASKNIPQLQDYFLEYSDYMKVWEEIEKARSLNYGDSHLVVAEKYAYAGKFLTNSRTFAEFAPHYEACSSLERAENFSRTDSVAKIEDAIKEFERAIRLFSESREGISRKISPNWFENEFEIPRVIVQASEFRQSYCEARTQVEHARLLHRRGDKFQSYEAYRSAAELLDKLAEDQKSVPERSEILAVALSCKGWAKMQEAEIHSSPELFEEASNLFIQARGLGMKDRASLISEGNSKYCIAMKFLVLFRRESRIEDYISAKTSLEEAAIAYGNSGVKDPPGWFKAAEKMLDASVFLNNALKETNPLSKTKNLIAAEKFLNTASAIYDENGYLTKKTEVEELLHKIREEKDFGLSLTEIFEAPSIVSSTESFDAPQLSRDQLVGLEVLQPAVHIVTNAPRKINLSESFEVRVDLINTGKDPVFLLSLEGLVPEQFKYEKDEDSEFQSYDKQALNRLILNGKKLSPFEVKSFNIKLRTEDSKLSEAILSPKISYSNARGELYEKTSSPTRMREENSTRRLHRLFS